MPEKSLKVEDDEVLMLTGENTNVKAERLAFGARVRLVTAECEQQLSALSEALEKHAFTATR